MPILLDRLIVRYDFIPEGVKKLRILSGLPFLFLFFFSHLSQAQTSSTRDQLINITNGAFEGLDGEFPNGWILPSGNEGKWEFTGKTGRSISVSGQGNDSSYWRSEQNPFSSDTFYRLRFSVFADGTGTVIAGSHLANIDLPASIDWQNKEFIFKTPQQVRNAFLRFGHWRFEGKVQFDDVSLVKVTPVHRHLNGLELGKGELIHDGKYTFYSDFTDTDGNSSRCLFQHTASFNTDRWVLTAQDQIIYQHSLVNQNQMSSEIKLQLQIQDGTKLLVECATDPSFDSISTVAQTIENSGEHTVQVPNTLLPANSIFIRFKAAGDCQITDYQYWATIEDNAIQFIGDTNYVEVIGNTGALEVEFKTIGDLNSGDNNQVAIDITNLIDYSMEVEAVMRINPIASGGLYSSDASSTNSRRVLTVGVAETWEILWTDYRLEQAGIYEMEIELIDRFYGESVFFATIPFHMSILYQADYGETVSKDDDIASIWWADATRKISRQQVPPTQRSSLVRLSAAKNEYEPFQIVVRPKHRLSQVTVASSNFLSEQNNLIPADQIQVNNVGYLLVRHPSDHTGSRGYWPDPLLPHNLPMELYPGQNYPFWLTFRTLPDLPAGTYRGTIIVSGLLSEDLSLSREFPVSPVSISQQTSSIKERAALSGLHENCIDASGHQPLMVTIEETVEEQISGVSAEKTTDIKTRKEGSIWQETIEVELKVWDFALSDETHIRSSFGFDPERVKKYHQLEDESELNQVLEKYYENFANHRISPENPMEMSPIITDFEGNWWLGGEQDSAVKVEGQHSLKVVDSDNASDMAAISRYNIRISKDKSYELSWHARTERSSQSYQLSILCLDQNNETFQRIDFPFVGNGQWERFWTQIGSFPSKTVSIRLAFFPIAPNSAEEKTGVAWFDQLSLNLMPTGENLIPDPDFERTVADWNITLDTNPFELIATRYLDELHFNAFQLPLEGMGTKHLTGNEQGVIEGYPVGTEEYNILFSGYLNQLQNYLEEKGWLDRAYVYWFDEPTEQDYQFVKAGMDRIHRFAPKINRFLTEQIEPELIESVELWCPIVPNFNPALAEERKAKGEQVWWYLRNQPIAPYVGSFIDHNAIDLRMWLWQTWHYKVNGIRIWQSNYWNDQDQSSGSIGQTLPQNPYQDPMSYPPENLPQIGNTRNWGNGDGRLIYPPPMALANYNDGQISHSLEGPINSIRMELLREGIEDYEYFWLLQDLVKNATDPEKASVREAEGYLIVPETVLTSLVSYSQNPDSIYAHRSVLAQMILKLTQEDK